MSIQTHNLIESADSMVALLNSIDSAVIIDDMSRVDEYFTRLRESGVTSFKEEWKRDESLLDEVLSRIETIWVNPRSVQLFEAESHEQLLASLPAAYAVEPEPFVGFLEAFFHNEKHFATEFKQPTLSGNLRDLCVTSYMTVMQGRVVSICTFTDTHWYNQQYQIAEIQNRYTSALKAASLGVWEFDFADGIYRINAEYRRMIGVGGELLAIPWMAMLERIHEDDRVAMARSSTAEQVDREFRVRRPDGSYVWLHENGVVTERDADGSPLRAAGTVRDITLSRRQRELDEVDRLILKKSMSGASDAQLAKLLAEGVERAFINHACFVLLFDKQCKIVEANGGPQLSEELLNSVVGACARALAINCNEDLQSATFLNVADLAGDLGKANVRTALASEGIESIVSMPLTGSGNAQLGVICLGATTADGFEPVEADGLVGLRRVARCMSLAIEERRHVARARLLDQQVQNRQKFESLGRLAGGIAHDFNNLLTAIMTNAEICGLERDNPESVASCAENISRTAEVAGSLCKQMLTYAGKVESKYQSINLSDQVSHICKLVRASIDQRVELQIDCASKLALIDGDTGTLSQIILNLLTNASEAIEGSGKIRIETGVRSIDDDDIARCTLGHHLVPGEYVYLAVSDDGGGLSEEASEHLFDPFYSTKAAGRGLGLATVIGIVEQHRAAVLLDSTLNEGTTFTILFPRSDGRVDSGDGPATSDDGSSRSHRVLVVDDQEILRAAICKILRARSIDVVDAASGEEALTTIAKSEKFDVILMDQQMPGLSGLDTYHELRADGDNVLVCFMTGFAASSELEAVIRLDNTTRLIRKPFDSQQLMEVLGFSEA